MKGKLVSVHVSRTNVFAQRKFARTRTVTAMLAVHTTFPPIDDTERTTLIS